MNLNKMETWSLGSTQTTKRFKPTQQQTKRKDSLIMTDHDWHTIITSVFSTKKKLDLSNYIILVNKLLLEKKTN